MEQIGQYIAGDDPEAARRFCSELVFAAKSLKTFPDRHGTFVKRPNIRKLPYENYLIFYKIYKDTQIVEILRFWHAAQNRHRLRLKEEPAAYAATAIAVP